MIIEFKISPLLFGVTTFFVMILIGCNEKRIYSVCEKDQDKNLQLTRQSRKLVVIGIHGLGKKIACKDLSEEWETALSARLKSNSNEPSANSFTFKLVYWARTKKAESSCNVFSRSDNERIMRSNIGEALDKVGKKLTEYQKKILSDSEKTGEGPIQLLTRLIPWEPVQKDLEDYYSNPTMKQSVWDKVSSVLREHQDAEIMLIAHSMGSIIAYDVLIETGLRVDHFVTIGSPLGTGAVKELLEGFEKGKDLLVPPGVKKWTNFYDRLDPVALDTTLRGSFRSNTHKGVEPEDKRVVAWLPSEGENFNSSFEIGFPHIAKALGNLRRISEGNLKKVNLARHHSSCGYLQSPEMTQILREFLN